MWKYEIIYKNLYLYVYKELYLKIKKICFGVCFDKEGVTLKYVILFMLMMVK